MVIQQQRNDIVVFTATYVTNHITSMTFSVTKVPSVRYIGNITNTSTSTSQGSHFINFTISFKVNFSANPSKILMYSSEYIKGFGTTTWNSANGGFWNNLNFFRSSNNGSRIFIPFSELPRRLLVYSQSPTITNHISEGSVEHLPRALNTFHMLLSRNIYGDLSKLPPNLINFEIIPNGLMSLSGNFADLNRRFYYLRFGGVFNKLTGHISNIPPNVNGGFILTAINNDNSPILYGNLNEIPDTCTKLFLRGGCFISGYQTKQWLNPMMELQFEGTNPLTTQEIEQLLIDLSQVSWTGYKTLNILSPPHPSIADTNQGGRWGDFSDPNNPQPTTVAIAYKTLGRTLTMLAIPGCIPPGSSGDGTGFPPGFGDWYRS